MISRIDEEVVMRADDGKPIEDRVVVIITDGYENASREFTGQMIADLVAARGSGPGLLSSSGPTSQASGTA
jgi:hypothetical protein